MPSIDPTGLPIFRDTPAGIIPCDGGEFVRLDDAARHFQWQALNRVLNLLQTFEGKTIRKGEIYQAVMEMRPERVEVITDEDREMEDVS